MRRHFVDNIRVITIILVVVYHVFYIFNGVTGAGVIGPVSNTVFQDVTQYALYPWFMVIFFIISGMSAKYYLENHTSREFIKSRTTKCLVPSTLGVIVFGALQGYLNMNIGGGYDDVAANVPVFVLIPIMIVSGTGVLWTLQVLWLDSIILTLVMKIEKGKLLEVGKRANIIVLLVLTVVVWGAAQILNTPVVAVYRLGIYITTFLLGYYVFSHDEVTAVLEKWSILLSVVAIGLGVAYTVVYFGENYAVEPAVNSPLAIAFGWIACLAIIGVMKRFFDKTSVAMKWLSNKSFGLYVFHYLPLSAVAYYMIKLTGIRGIAAYLITAFAGFAGAWIMYEVVSRIPVIRWILLGMKGAKKDA